MRLVHYYAPLFETQSGVTMAMADWAEAQATHGHDVLLIGAGDPSSSEQPFPSGVRVEGLAHRGRRRATRVPVGLSSRIQSADFLLLHEGWTTSHYAAALAARRAGVPYIVMPHGVHTPEWAAMMRALRVRRRLESAMIRRAAAVHLFFAAEAVNTLALSPEARTFVAPTGTAPAVDHWKGGRPELLWIGRYSVRHKGLDLLLEALAAVPAQSRPHLLMRGNDYRGGKAEVTTLVDQLGLAGHVTVGPPVGGAEKEALLLECAGYVQPSRWESHSIGLLEALTRGVPSLVSDRMPISPDLDAAGAALVADVSRDELGAALVRLAAGVPGLGSRGLAYVTAQFGWDATMERFEKELTGLMVQPC